MRQQAIRYLATGSVAGVLVVVLILMANWIGAHKYKRLDWTSNQLYSLSEKTRNILLELEEEIEIKVFMVPGSPLYPQVREMADRYSAASNKVKVEFIDHMMEPLRAFELKERYGISVQGTVVFAYQERIQLVAPVDMAEFDYSQAQYGAQPSLKGFRGEEQFTATILKLVAEQVPKVYFVTGHGEAGISAANTLADRGLTRLAKALGRDNIEFDDTDLFTGKIPEDADMLAIIGPTVAYGETEVELLEAYLEGGGRLLVGLDPHLDSYAETIRPLGLEDLLSAWGVTVGNDMVLDPERYNPAYGLAVMYLPVLDNHPVTTGIDGVHAEFTITRSVEASAGADVRAQTLVETGAEGWGETSVKQLNDGAPVFDDDDIAGPVSVAVAVAGPETEQGDGAADQGFRLVVFGDSEFFTDSWIAELGNRALALNAFNWLVAREGALGIPPREVNRTDLSLTSGQLFGILAITLLFMPGMAIGIGVAVWFRRRH